MKLTCLSNEDGFQFPPCHMLNICGFRVLIDCPLDLSAITIFSPVPYDVSHGHGGDKDFECPSDMSVDAENPAQKRQKVKKRLSPGDLVCAEPWYKTVKALHLWEVSFINVVLISSPMGLLGLPFLTQNPSFSAKVDALKIYVTEATAKVGQLVMEDLVSMHMEFRQFYGPETSSYPWWMRDLELEEGPSLLKNIVFGENKDNLGAWMPLYSIDDVKDCMKKVQAVKFAEEVCYNGAIIIKALSSGLDIGACNWLINGPERRVSYVSGSVFVSPHAMDFDYHGLKGNDVICFSDFSCLHSAEETENDSNNAVPVSDVIQTESDKNNEASTASLLNHEETSEEMEKLAFICSCAADSANAGGSTLITISRIGVVLQLLELIATTLESSPRKVPIYVISSVAEELLAYVNTIPEWLCQRRQEKFFSGEPLFAHTKLIKDKKIHVFPAIYSPNLITSWQEPCIIFAPHWSMRLGPSVQILRRWCGDSNSLLVLEDGVDASLALLPFRPMAMKVLQCSFLSGIRLQKILPLLNILQPKIVLFPESMSQRISFPEVKPYSVLRYSENQTLRVPNIADGAEVEITTNLAAKLNWRKLSRENFNIARLKGELQMQQGKHKLLSGVEPEGSMQQVARPLRHWGSVAPKMLMDTLAKMGLDGSVEQSMDDKGSEDVGVILIESPKSAKIEIREGGTIINTDDESLGSLVFQAINCILDGI